MWKAHFARINDGDDGNDKYDNADDNVGEFDGDDAGGGDDDD